MSSKLQRNALCSCGSGKKYKRCCEKKQDLEPPSTEQLVAQYGWSSVLEHRKQQELEAQYFGNRARALLAWYDVGDPPKKKRTTKAQSIEQRQGAPIEPRRRGHVGHPTRKSSNVKRVHWHRPDKDEAHVREISRQVREERMQRKTRGDGDISGLLAVASREAADILALDADTAAAVSWYLYGVWGEIIHRFDPSLTVAEMTEGLPSFESWRYKEVVHESV